MMHKKGFFFSLDALLALFVVVFFLVVLFYSLSRFDVSQLGNTELLEYSRSVATVMESEKSLSSLENISSFLGNYTRSGVCFNVTTYNAFGNPQISAVKPGCTNGSYPTVLYRTFLSENSLFSYALFRSWYA